MSLIFVLSECIINIHQFQRPFTGKQGQWLNINKDCLLNIFMQVKKNERMLRAQRIALFQAERDRKPESNPEQDATNNLIEISNQQYDFLEQQDFSEPTKQDPEPNEKISRSNKRVPVAENFTKSHRNWRKTSVNFFSGEEVCVMRKERIVNLSNFLIFQNDDLRTSLPQNKPKPEQLESPRPRNSKMLLNFIRKRNLNYQREEMEETRSTWKRVGSPLQRINQSCELKRQKEEPNKPLVRQFSSSKAQIYSNTDFRTTSPNFRNKKVANYFKYRLGKNPDPIRP